MDRSLIVLPVVAAIGAASLILRGRGRRAQREKMAARWGRADRPRQLDADDFRDIGAYCRERGTLEPCAVDEITWNDLDMDAVFARLDRACSNVGEEVLYDMLHRSDASDAALARRARIVGAVAQDAQCRTRMRMALSRLGHARFHGAHAHLFHPETRRPAHAALYPVLGLAPVALALLGLLFPACFLGVAVMFAVNLVVYYRGSKVFMREIAAVRHIAAVIETARRLERCLPPQLSDIAQDMRAHVERLRPVRRWSALFAMQRVSDLDFLTDYVRILFQLDMICLCRLSACFARENESLRALYALIGEIDACLAVASWRDARGDTCVPEFADEMRVTAQNLVHPLVKEPVGNDIDWTRGALLTGSNASGKSTFIKALAVNAILAQTVGVCTAGALRMPRARVMTSMALRDSVRGGESYFVVEVRSLKRMLMQVQSGDRVLCMIDEILRGTNTTERIAASAAFLRSLNRANCLCMAATHDLELTRLLGDYRQLHFSESLTPSGMDFPYKLAEGPSTTRNAIALMRQMGFPREIVEEAEQAAAGFDSAGCWDAGGYSARGR
ncbi:MAG: hypothetical protein Q4F18_12205 [Clostridia bacterium]|nr:hypothetical protein [Clostridia bacterium]